MVTICKQFNFDAAHFLPNVEDGHKCKRLHGHTYRVDVICRGPIDARGMVCDYAEIAAAWMQIDMLLDHRLLNDVPGLENPTTEVLSPWILAEIRKWSRDLPIIGVRVYESSTTWCEASIDD